MSNPTTHTATPNATVTGAVISLVNALARAEAATGYVATRMYALLLAKPEGFGSDVAYATWLVEQANTGAFKHDTGKADPNAVLSKYTAGSLRASMSRARGTAVKAGYEGDPTGWAKAIEEGRAKATAGRANPDNGGKSGSDSGKGRKVVTSAQKQAAAAVLKSGGLKDLAPAIVDRLQHEATLAQNGATPKRGTKAGDEYVHRCESVARASLLAALAAGVDVQALVADVLAAAATPSAA